MVLEPQELRVKEKEKIERGVQLTVVNLEHMEDAATVEPGFFNTEKAAKSPKLSSDLKRKERVELVSVDDLWPYIGEDRSKNPKPRTSLDTPTEEQLEILKDEFSSGEPIRQPIELGYDPDSGKAATTDGNTRYRVLVDVGFEYVPVRVFVTSLFAGRKPPEAPDIDFVKKGP